MMKNDNKLILIVEDDEPKLQAIKDFFQIEFPNFQLVYAASLTSAISCLTANEVHFAVIDMSLPTYDFALDHEGGGTPQGFGGEDILRFIDSECPNTKSVILTQYQAFEIIHSGDSLDLDAIDRGLHKELGPNYLMTIYYAGQHGEWRTILKNAITSPYEESE
jgi:ActR/RegA family two-component response regulator